MMLRVAVSPTEVAAAPTTADGDYDPLSGAPPGTHWHTGYDPLR
jgi:hypothetical protein